MMAVASALDHIADELYAAHPDKFAGARDARVKELRAAGKKDEAGELAKLRRPTVSAWVVNLLAREARGGVEQLLGVGEEMAAAQAKGDVAELRRLTARRPEVEAALIRDAHSLVEKAGAKMTAATELEVGQTLSAALASAEVADEVRDGRLLKPASYAGFGEVMVVKPAVKPAARTAEKPKPATEKPSELSPVAKLKLEAARAALKAAEAELEEQAEAAEKAEKRLTELRAEVDDLRERLRERTQQATAAERDARIAGQRRDAAEKAHDKAQEALAKAEKAG